MTWKSSSPVSIKIDEFSLAAEQGRCRTEVASHRATDGGNQDGRRTAGSVAETDAHHLPTESRDGQGVFDGFPVVLTQIPLKPADSLAADDQVCVDHPIEPLFVADVPADHNRRGRLMPTDQLAHLLDLAYIGDDGADTDHVIGVFTDLFRETLQRGEIQEGAGGIEVGLNHHQSEGTMKHPERESPLDARHLILIQFHRVDPAASVFVIPGVRAEDTREQDAGAASEGMDWLNFIDHAILLFCGHQWRHGDTLKDLSEEEKS